MVDKDEVAKSRLTALLSMLCALGLPAVAAAQDMSFDLDEAESAEADADADAEADAELEGEVEAGAEGEAGADVGGGGDIFDELTEDEGVLEEDEASRVHL
ncbi:MAG: hypothetical protein OXT09_20625 [Myxococcales bacterium]|nr:hypothetical protein [Myxococcales bacterium]